AEGAEVPLDSLGGRRVAAFCGIGNPEGFRRTLQGLNVQPVAFRVFPDHHPYSRTDVEDLIDWGRSIGADLILTTQKDSVKLRLDSLGAVPLRALRIGLEVLHGREILDDALRKVWAADSLATGEQRV
ncbi:MAG TPA: tetraacyldisaccharide 4'-kinase, partial [Isosphaeraceae bacterium]|nr:tetraacyldisaccharide 4'-kinase [Isosphaeraceae bacterium]